MSNALTLLPASGEPHFQADADHWREQWSSAQTMEQTPCTISGTNTQTTNVRSLSLSTSDSVVFLKDEPAQRSIPLYSSSSRTLRSSSSLSLRKARQKDLHNLKGWQVNDLYRADAIADCMGLRMNLFISINWLLTGTNPHAFVVAFQRGCKRMGQWIRDNDADVPVCFVYVHENPGGDRPNTHLLICVPKYLINIFSLHVNKWFCGVNENAVKVEPRTIPGWTPETRLNYMIKGAPYLVCEAYGAKRKKGGQGPVECKRSGVSQFLRNQFGGRYDRNDPPMGIPVRRNDMPVSGEALKLMRTRVGLSQAELAKVAKVHRNTIVNLEQFVTIPQSSQQSLKKVMRIIRKAVKQGPYETAPC